MVIAFTSRKKQQSTIDGEIPTGAIDNINKVFTTNNKFLMTPNNQISVYINGVRQTIVEDYNVFESVIDLGFDTIELIITPKVGDNLLVDYKLLNC